jgi:peptide/nickel transport system ATP-binding protein
MTKYIKLRRLQLQADSVVTMQAGGIVGQGWRDDIFDSPQHDYTKALLAARPMVEFGRPEGVRVPA